MVIKEDYLQWFNFFDKKSALLNKSSRSGVANEPNYQLANELHNRLLRNLKKKMFIHLLETMVGVLI